MYPKASGRSIKASNLMKALCQLAGIQDVGIKIQVPTITTTKMKHQTNENVHGVNRSHLARAQREIGSATVQLGLLCVHAWRQECLSKFLQSDSTPC
jgi:ribosomal protein S5